MKIQDYRRQYPRYTVEGQAKLRAGEEADQPSLLKDISLRGAGILSKQPLDPQEKLDIVIHVPSLFPRPVSTSARVVWCDKIGDNLWQAGLDFGLANEAIFNYCF